MSRVIHGPAREVLSTLLPDSIHLTFTSPPYYNTKDYGQHYFESYRRYLNMLTEVFWQVRRVTKEGRFLVINSSPVIEAREKRSKQSHRFGIPFDIHKIVTDGGWLFIDDIIWVKPEAAVKNRVSGFRRHRKPLTYKSNQVTEYVMVYRKYTDKLIDWNLRQYDKEVVKESLVGEFPSSNVWPIAPTSNSEHPAVFPVALSDRIVRLYSMKGDVVLDPFAGSGTVGQSCRKLDREYVLIDSQLEYVELMRSRGL